MVQKKNFDVSSGFFISHPFKPDPERHSEEMNSVRILRPFPRRNIP